MTATLPPSTKFNSTERGHFQRGRVDKVAEILFADDRKIAATKKNPFIHISLGETDQAFEWLEKAYQDRSSRLLLLRTEPAFDSLRSDPRYQNLLRRIGLPQ